MERARGRENGHNRQAGARESNAPGKARRVLRFLMGGKPQSHGFAMVQNAAIIEHLRHGNGMINNINNRESIGERGIMSAIKRGRGLLQITAKSREKAVRPY